MTYELTSLSWCFKMSADLAPRWSNYSLLGTAGGALDICLPMLHKELEELYLSGLPAPMNDPSFISQDQGNFGSLLIFGPKVGTFARFGRQTNVVSVIRSSQISPLCQHSVKNSGVDAPPIQSRAKPASSTQRVISWSNAKSMRT